MNFDVIKKIDNHLADDISKELFENRLLYDYTHDAYYARKMAETTKEGKKCKKFFLSKKKKVIFGAGIYGKRIKDIYDNVDFDCYIDNNIEKVEEGFFNKLPIIHVNEYIKRYCGENIVIASREYNQEMFRQLIDAGIKKENILNFGKLVDKLTYTQYFDLIPFQEQKNRMESFIDGGALDGRSSMMFQKWCKGKYSKIWIFEPDPINVNKCKNFFCKNNIKDYVIVPKGISDINGEVNFEACANGLSHINQNGKVKIVTCRIDDIVGNEQVTFIKMDIEGSEYQGLRGAEKTIRKQKPKLAISVYHKTEDIINLAELILEYNPNYKLYIRHYMPLQEETVLYAI